MNPMNGIMNLCGKDYELRFDIVALTSAQSLLKTMGFKRENVWSLGDVPYDLLEEVILVTQGINGARRLAKDKSVVTLEDVQNLFQEHFDYLAEKVQAIEDESEAMRVFQDEQTKLMTVIGEAVRSGIGFRRSTTKGGATREQRVDA